MRSTIDNSIPISWCLEMSNGSKWFETSNQPRSAWLLIKNKIYTESLCIKRMHLFSTKNTTGPDTFHGALTPEYAKGYFYMNKMVASIGLPQIDIFALGYLDNSEQVNIRWYNIDMTCIENEIRSSNLCELGLIRNLHSSYK